MTISDVAICNLALDLLGADTISQIGENSKAGKLCQRNYEPLRDAVLRAYPWNSVTRRATLAKLDAAPAWGFANQYQLPEGPNPERWLAMAYVEGELEGTASRYKIEGRKLLSDDGPSLNILYIARITDPTLYDPLLVQAMAARIAWQLAFPITGERSVAADMANMYRALLLEARRRDAQEGTADPVEPTGWWDSRLAAPVV